MQRQAEAGQPGRMPSVAKTSVGAIFTALMEMKHEKLSLLLSYLGGLDLLLFMRASKSMTERIDSFYAKKIELPLDHYRFYFEKTGKPFDQATLIHHAVKDYIYLIEVLEWYKKTDQRISPEDQVKFLRQLSIFIRNMTATRLLLESKEVLESTPADCKKTWDTIISCMEEKNKIRTQNARDDLSRSERASTKLEDVYNLVSNQTSVVVTVSSLMLDDFSKFTSQRLKNYFQSGKKRLVKDVAVDSEYFFIRLTTEVVQYRHCSPETLLAMILDANSHPCYGTLQFTCHIQLMKHYGDFFIVMQPGIKESALACVGTGFNRPFARFYCLKNPDAPYSLMNDFSNDMLQACNDYVGSSGKRKNLLESMKLDEPNNKQYMEVLYPSNIPFSDPTYVRHIHFKSMFLPIDTMYELMKKGIYISVHFNPFRDKSFCQYFDNNRTEELLIQKILSYIESALQHIGETTSSHLKIQLDSQVLRVIMRITPEYYKLHQAQAAAILYLLGVCDYFKKNPAILFNPGSASPFVYDLHLDGVARKEGGLTDQDAYTHHYSSLLKLLNHLLKRIFSILLVSRQNAEYLLRHNRPHPITGLGATEESNQTKPLWLGDEKNHFDIAAYWFYDHTVIKVISENIENFKWVCKVLESFGLKFESNKNHIYLQHGLHETLKIIEARKFHYHAMVIYSDTQDHEGDLLLAFRVGSAYSISGGHNNNYYNFDGQNEFGTHKNFKESVRKYAGVVRHSEPPTAYHFLPTSCFSSMKEDAFEFLPGSLNYFSVYQLGAITSDQLSAAAACFKVSQEQYREVFGQSLALRPLPGILVYLEECEKKLSDLLSKIFLEPCSVKVMRNYEEIRYNQRRFWKPDRLFGKIRIYGPFYRVSAIINYLVLCSKQKIEYVREKTNVSSLICNMNPFSMIRLLQSAPPYCDLHRLETLKLLGLEDDPSRDKEKKDDSGLPKFISRVEGSTPVEKKCSDKYEEKRLSLKDQEPVKLARAILILNKTPGFDLISFFLDRLSGIEYLNKFVCLLYPEFNDNRVRKIELTAEERRILSEAIGVICQEKEWNEVSLLQHAVDLDRLPAVRFLVERKHFIFDTRRPSNEWSALHHAIACKNKKMVRYLSSFCPFYYSDYAYCYAFFKSPRNQIWAFHKTLADEKGQMVDLDVSSVQPEFSLIPESSLEEELSAYEINNQDRINAVKIVRPAYDFKKLSEGQPLYELLAVKKSMMGN